jgi:hypothetical protein
MCDNLMLVYGSGDEDGGGVGDGEKAGKRKEPLVDLKKNVC